MKNNDDIMIMIMTMPVIMIIIMMMAVIMIMIMTMKVIMMMIMTKKIIKMIMTFKVLDSRLEVQPSDTLHWGVGGEVTMKIIIIVISSSVISMIKDIIISWMPIGESEGGYCESVSRWKLK